MPQTPTTPFPPRSRRLLRAVAVAACLPYLGLKTAWVAGSHLGIPAGSPLLDDRVALAAANALTILMDGAVIVLVLLLTRPWGRAVPAWLLAAPMWVATGLLAPIMAGYPLQLLVGALGDGAGSGGGDGRPFLEGWVFAVVYGGFIVQGLALGALFVLYARDRWGHLWRGRTADLRAGATGRPGQRALAAAALVLVLFPLTLRAVWACGGTVGLTADAVADRGADAQVLEGVYVVFLLAAVAGAWALVPRRAPGPPVRVPLAAALVGSAAVACWGGWMTAAALLAPGDPADRPTDLMLLTYAGQMTVGLLVAAVCVRFLAGRSARLPAA